MSDFVPSGWKTCSDCDRLLPLTDFHSNKSREDGRAFYCKQCARARMEVSRRKRGIAPVKKSDVPVPDGMKWCPDCKQIKPANEFPPSKTKRTGLHSYCLPCHNVRSVESKVKHHGSTREYHLRHRYNMDQADFDAMLAAQGGVCAICGAPGPEHVDHDHLFGNVRGILCFNCNGGLGQFKDDRANLRKAIDYLEETSWQRVLVHPGVYRLVSPRRERRPSPSS
ncbi:endonuclease VII domain-containing protein [Catellatospora sp. KI3]|uniref:endonuclease VII domain-containing protein n=1 Tax=Catellatospora sp. KI3 TaxID=3041620 RepID=UPI0024826986|nr:endonuclease VII domain-containing protein [Catellatospora sp. KI3]MDI1464532.1 endonuclease VII domain-containing protein [Catellatospora sp. KI3]